MKTIIMSKLAVNHVAMYCVLIGWSTIKLYEAHCFFLEQWSPLSRGLVSNEEHFISLKYRPIADDHQYDFKIHIGVALQSSQCILPQIVPQIVSEFYFRLFSFLMMENLELVKRV